MASPCLSRVAKEALGLEVRAWRGKQRAECGWPPCRYKVNTTAKLFALKEQDLDTIISPLALGTRSLFKDAWLALRPPRSALSKS